MNSIVVALLKGMALGFTMAAIPGPIMFLIIQRTLNDGALIGFLCGLGAVTADAFYALVAAIGLTMISYYLLTFQPYIVATGGIFLLYLGATTYLRTVTSLNTNVGKNHNAFQAWFSTFLLTLTNPVTIVTYSIIFAGFDAGSNSLVSSLAIVLGVILGALTIPIIIISVLSYFHQQISLRTLTLINKIAGILLTFFGVAAIVRSMMILGFI